MTTDTDAWADPADTRKTKVSWLHALAGLALTALAIASLSLAAIPAIVLHRPGATRSAELTRQERLAQIEAALAEEDAQHD
jgi:hypothetical protein